MWLALWLRTLGFNVLFIAGVCMIIAFVMHAGSVLLVPPGAAMAVWGARGLRHTMLAE